MLKRNVGPLSQEIILEFVRTSLSLCSQESQASRLRSYLDFFFGEFRVFEGEKENNSAWTNKDASTTCLVTKIFGLATPTPPPHLYNLKLWKTSEKLLNFLFKLLNHCTKSYSESTNWIFCLQMSFNEHKILTFSVNFDWLAASVMHQQAGGHYIFSSLLWWSGWGYVSQAEIWFLFTFLGSR